jgi:hypothetical protein
MSAISLRRTASWAEASPTSARSSRTRISRGDSAVVVVVVLFLAAQAAVPVPVVATSTARARLRRDPKGRCGIPQILSNTSNSYNDPHRGRRYLRVKEAPKSDC